MSYVIAGAMGQAGGVALGMLSREDLVRLVEELRDGVAVLAGPGRELVYINAAGRGLLDHPGADAIRLAAAAGGPDAAGRRGDGRATVEITLHDRRLEMRSLRVEAADGECLILIFRDLTDLRRHEDRLTTFSRTSASLAFAETLTAGLDALARDVRGTTDMDSCTFLLMGPDGELRQVGMSGDYPMAVDYGERIRACRARGAPLLALQAMVERRPLVVSGWRERTLADPRFAPLHDITRDASWDTIAVIPLVLRGDIVGVFNGFYLAGRGPSEDEIAFLSAVADQAAVAVDNARLLIELERRATLDERHRLARELHDSVSQALFSLTLQARAVEVMASEDAPPMDAVRDGLAEVRELSKGALAEMRALIFQLRPEALHEEGLAASIRRHAAAAAAREGIEVCVEGPATLEDLSAEEETELFRVVVEAMTNAVKHARATTIVARLLPEDDGCLAISVDDDGVGFDPARRRSGHLGLTSMAERVSRLGGTLEVHSAAGRGTSVRVRLPRAGRRREEVVSHARG